MESIISGHRQCFSSPNSPDAPSAARHLLSFTFSPAAAALALSSPSLSLSASGLHYLHLHPLSLPLLLIVSHYHSLPFLSGARVSLCRHHSRLSKAMTVHQEVRSNCWVLLRPCQIFAFVHPSMPLPGRRALFSSLPICQLQFPLHKSHCCGEQCQTVGMILPCTRSGTEQEEEEAKIMFFFSSSFRAFRQAPLSFWQEATWLIKTVEVKVEF